MGSLPQGTRAEASVPRGDQFYSITRQPPLGTLGGTRHILGTRYAEATLAGSSSWTISWRVVHFLSASTNCMA